MTWHSILAGVDGSDESAQAARFAACVAQRAGVACRLLHAVPDYAPTFSTPETPISVEHLNDAAQLEARRLVELSLEDRVPPAVVDALEVRLGRGPSLLSEAAQQRGADVVILGAKRHHALARIGGTTITHLVRLGGTPVLAHTNGITGIRRVLAAVDLSLGAKPTIDAAEKWAALYDADLRVMHTIEPLPVVPGFAMGIGDDAHYHQSREAVLAAISPLLVYPKASLVIRRGRAAAAIAGEAARWEADLIVVGSHGKGWVDRLLIGSTSERLLHVLPAPTLIVPVFHHAPRMASHRQEVLTA